MLHLRLDNTENASLRTFTWRPIYDIIFTPRHGLITETFQDFHNKIYI